MGGMKLLLDTHVLFGGGVRPSDNRLGCSPPNPSSRDFPSRASIRRSRRLGWSFSGSDMLPSSFKKLRYSRDRESGVADSIFQGARE